MEVDPVQFFPQVNALPKWARRHVVGLAAADMSLDTSTTSVSESPAALRWKAAIPQGRWCERVRESGVHFHNELTRTPVVARIAPRRKSPTPVPTAVAAGKPGVLLDVSAAVAPKAGLRPAGLRERDTNIPSPLAGGKTPSHVNTKRGVVVADAHSPLGAQGPMISRTALVTNMPSTAPLSTAAPPEDQDFPANAQDFPANVQVEDLSQSMLDRRRKETADEIARMRQRLEAMGIVYKSTVVHTASPASGQKSAGRSNKRPAVFHTAASSSSSSSAIAAAAAAPGDAAARKGASELETVTPIKAISEVPAVAPGSGDAHLFVEPPPALDLKTPAAARAAQFHAIPALVIQEEEEEDEEEKRKEKNDEDAGKDNDQQPGADESGQAAATAELANELELAIMAKEEDEPGHHQHHERPAVATLPGDLDMAQPVPAERYLAVVERLNAAFDDALEAYEETRDAPGDDSIGQTARVALERQFNAMLACLDGLCTRRSAGNRDGVVQALLADYSERLLAAVTAAAKHHHSHA